MREQETNFDPVAICGIALRVPEATNLQRFWRNILFRRDCLTRLTAGELHEAGISQKQLSNPGYIRSMPMLADIDHFDAAFFDMSGQEAERTEPAHRLFLECAWESLEDAGVVPGRGGSVIGVFGGCEGSYLANVLSHHDYGEYNPALAITLELGNAVDFFTTRVSHKLDLTGPSVSMLSACATSLQAVHLAIQSLRRGECDTALAGGATVESPPQGGYIGGVEGMLSATGYIRPFDAKADGTVFGSGVGVVALKRLEDAVAEGNPIYAVLRGSGSSNDGNPDDKESFIAPAHEGQAAVIRAALDDARTDPRSIGYLEAHGTGTFVGDPIEVSSATTVYRRHTGDTGYCSLGSVKANVGHLRTAAGVVGLVKVCLALRHRVIPPQANFDQPNPRIELETTPFTIDTVAREWPEPVGTPRRAAVSAFGFGGSNAHVILEEYRPSNSDRPAGHKHLFVLSAKSRTALERRTSDLRVYMEEQKAPSCADVAYTLQCGRKEFDHRACFYLDEDEPLASFPEPQATGRVESSRPLVFLFPGQGSQHPRMGLEFYAEEKIFRDLVDQCAERLLPDLGSDLRVLLEYRDSVAQDKNTEETLRRTANAQPALFVVEYAMARVFMSQGVEPSVMLGHSIGELVAACIAGVFSLDDGLKLVAARARLMQQCEPGAMAAVFMEASKLEKFLPDGIELAAINAPTISVVSGPSDTVQAFSKGLEENGVGSRLLATSHAFHSRMMDPALDKFAAVLDEIELKAPNIPVISNTSGLLLSAEQAKDRQYWVNQIRFAVRFSDGLQSTLQHERPAFLEVGPGRTLCDLVRLQEPDMPVFPGAMVEIGEEHVWDGALKVIGQLWCAGVEIEWQRLYKKEKRCKLHMPTYPFERRRYWQEKDDRSAGLILNKPLYETGWRESNLDANVPDKSQRPWLIFQDELGLGEAFAADLKLRGEDVISLFPETAFREIDTHRFGIRPGSKEDLMEALNRATRINGGLAPRILHLWLNTGSEGPHNDLEAFKLSGKLGFFTLLALTQAAYQRGICDQLQVMVVADGLACIPEEDVMLHSEKAGLLGICRVVPLEISGLSMRCVDIPSFECGDPPSWVVDDVNSEFLKGQDTFVALRPDKRFIDQLYRVPSLPMSRPRLREGGTVLITGGVGALGLTFAVELFKFFGARLILTSRWQPPAEEQWQKRSLIDDKIGRALRKILDLRSCGAEVMIVTADMADQASVARAVSEGQARFGAIHGVVHASGSNAMTPAMHKTIESAESVFASKVHAVFNLERIFSKTPLDICIYCSSLAGFSPIAGQVDYAAANLVLDALARNRARKRRGLSCAIAWGAWQELGMAIDLLDMDKDYQRARRMVVGEDDTNTETIKHPILRTRRYRGAEILYRGLLETSQWIVDEHRLEDKLVLPGTGVIELVRAAFVDHVDEPLSCVELSRIALLRLLFVEERGAEIEIRFIPRGGKKEFEFRSRNPGSHQWIVNASGFCSLSQSGPDVVVVPTMTTESIKLESIVETFPHSRWEIIQSMWRSSDDTISFAHLKLPADFLDDLSDFGLHPALFDGGGCLVSACTGSVRLPYTWDVVRIYGDLPAELFVQGNHRMVGGSLVFDFVFFDTQGEVLVEVDGYVTKDMPDISSIASIVPIERESEKLYVPSVPETGTRLIVCDPGDINSLQTESFAPRAPARDEVQIEVFAAGLNFRDVLSALGQMPDAGNGKLNLGSECSGVITSVGKGVKRLAPGDEVVAIAPDNALGSHTTVHVNNVVKLPGNLDFERAAGIPIVFLTAQYALDEVAQLKPDERILIHSAAGGVGLASVQIAKKIGAEIFATAGNQAKRDYLESIGIEHVMDSRSLEFVENISEITSNEGVDVVLNSIAGEYIEAGLSLLRPRGRFLEIGKRDIYANTQIGLYPFRNNLAYMAIDLGKIIEENDPILPDMFECLMDSFACGDFEPLPTTVVPIDSVAKGFRRMARAEHIGKIVFRIQEDFDVERVKARGFRQMYGDGVSLKWGRDVFRRLLSSDQTPSYVLASGYLFENETMDYKPRPEEIGDRVRPDLKVEYQAPVSETQKTLTDLWEKTLGVSPIGIDDNFFDVGGDSIGAIQIQYFINRDFAINLSNTDFLENFTVSALAELIEEAAKEA